jgi:citrate lyase subunit beta/citryl-CoA lyase
MRSLLFVPGDQPDKLAKAFASEADALILDLEDSVAPVNKELARRTVLAFLQEHGETPDAKPLHVRINGLDTSLADGDLDVVMTGAPAGIVLPKASGGPDIARLDARIAVREALHNIPAGSTTILAIALGTYAGSSPRLSALAWGAEDLSADIGAVGGRIDGGWSGPAGMARNLCLFGAAAASVAAIDSIYGDHRDLDGLKRECETAAHDGFAAKLAIHPAQAAIINAAFTPGDEAVAHAERVVEAFSLFGDAGVTSLDGQMLDRPHLKAAERLLARASRLRPAPPAPSDSEPAPDAEMDAETNTEAGAEGET